jgi:putative transposase
MLAINGMPDHVHLLFGFRPTQSLSDLMQDVKGSSSKWINEKRFVQGKFSWLLIHKADIRTGHNIN